MAKINWGIIGCGDVTELKSGPAFNKVPDSRLVAVMRRDAAKARDYAERHGVPQWYSDARALIDDPEVNAIYIATPPLFHEEYALAAIAAGKPVYLEKPMAINAASAERIVEAVHKNNIKCTVAHYRRQQPLFLKIRELINTGVVGDIRMVSLHFFQPPGVPLVAQTEVPWRLDPAVSGGGFFHDLAPHQLDLMIYFFGKPKAASGFSLNNAGLYEADDTVSGQAIFQNNILFTGAWCFAAPQSEDLCQITGSDGTIVFSVFRQHEIILKKEGSNRSYKFEVLQHVQQPMIEKTVHYFLGRSSNPCTAEEGLESMKLSDAFAGIREFTGSIES